MLTDVATLLRTHEEIKSIQIEGHTNNVGSRSMNRQLSQERSNAVLQFLLERGVEKERMSAIGYGPDQPIASNDTEEGRAQNRRVLIRILDRAQ